MKPLLLSAYTITNALGRGNAAMLGALIERRSGLRPCDFAGADLDTWIGRVAGLEQRPVEGRLAAFDCRNNRLAALALEQDGFASAVGAARARYGAHRIGVFLGTSTSGIRATEQAYGNRDDAGGLPADFRFRTTHDTFSLADFVARTLEVGGPVLIVSTACSSSAKVFASAYRHMGAGLCDAAIVGGVDSLCLMTLYGFGSLGLVSPQPCRPWDVGRSGISLGEGAGFALLEWPAPGAAGVALTGYGESSDAHHMSTPHPEGRGAALAMSRALERAGLSCGDVDYINLHGTGTIANDCSEDRALQRVFGSSVPCSSTKGWTGHTLGAAGITEAVLCCLCLENGLVPGSLNTDELDPSLSSAVVLDNRRAPLRRVMSNSFGFGGSNCSLVLASPDAP